MGITGPGLRDLVSLTRCTFKTDLVKATIEGRYLVERKWLDSQTRPSSGLDSTRCSGFLPMPAFRLSSGMGCCSPT
jgi:hypothetical protein